MNESHFKQTLNQSARDALDNGRYVVDPRGKDCGFERWRIDVYYLPNYADTLLLPKDEYDKFLQQHQNNVI